MSFLTLIGLIVIALGVSALFVWGMWELLTGPGRKRKKHEQNVRDFSLQRHAQNPILKPTSHDFEREAVMNPGVVHDGDKTHLFYRAIGADGVSRIGYAASQDGLTIDERLPYPVFALEGSDPYIDALRRSYAEQHYPALVASGGSWGGTEDPRAVIIDDRLYLSFSAFQNWDSVRIGVTSLALSDLKDRKWKWSKPTFLSPSNQVQKNWVMFPEKINNQFAVLHSVSPSVQIDYRHDLAAIGRTEPYIESPQGARTRGRKSRWDNWMRGAGPAPLKTDKGWLLFYHATDREKLSHLYQVGAMLLDKDDPSKVIAQSPTALLTPSTDYELGGAKPGVVYACGATAHDDQLNVYYGAADNFVCVASTSLSQFIHKLMQHEPVLPQPRFKLI